VGRPTSLVSAGGATPRAAKGGVQEDPNMAAQRITHLSTKKRRGITDAVMQYLGWLLGFSESQKRKHEKRLLDFEPSDFASF
jgi:hypothetical protein